ncbi:MAG: hypothetical protein II978_08065 [Clostridia bacterium]|nr:hypothetical protein [Clostridia bacterium]
MKRRLLLGVLAIAVVSSFAGCSAKDNMEAPVSPSAAVSDMTNTDKGSDGNLMTSSPTADATQSADIK